MLNIIFMFVVLAIAASIVAFLYYVIVGVVELVVATVRKLIALYLKSRVRLDNRKTVRQ